MRIVFMGTPDFALPSLERLLADGHEVTLVVTQADKAVGRKQILTPPPVKQLAVERGIPVFQPASMKTDETYDRLAAEQPDCIVVVAYGKIIPKRVLDLPKYGCVNVHGSLLPRFRGAAPIQWAVLAGDEESGVATMQMDEGLDTGDILLERRRKVGEMTAGELFDALAADGADVLSDTLKGLEAGTITPKPQVGESVYAPMLTKADSPMDFGRKAVELYNQVRGLNPWPTAQTTWNGKMLKVHAAKVGGKTNGKPGEIVSGKPLCVACGDGMSLELVTVQIEGGKAMDAATFWRGHELPLGTIIGKV